MTKTATSVQAQDLKVGDRFVYSSVEVTVEQVLPLDTRLVEVTVTDPDAPQGKRWVDFGRAEVVEVIAGPSTWWEAPATPAPEPVKSATQRAREAVRLGKVRSMPASAALVLYALAAAQDEQADPSTVPSVSSVAVGAGLAVSTTKGHLAALRAKGLVRDHRLGWSVA